MHIRDLKKEDAPLMLEWMHDCELTEFLHRDFSKLTIEDAERFINNSTGVGSLHYAITSDEDEYMGTVSLKNIKNGSAEFGICLRRKALGCGYAWFAMESIVRRGFDEFGLESIYWCVSKRNVRAVRFYEKHCFHQTFDMPQEVLNEYSDQEDLMWFSILKGDKINSGESVAGCRIISIKTIPTLDAGELSFFEENRDIPFEVKRIYYISKVPKGARRGFHAHKHLKQLLFCRLVYQYVSFCIALLLFFFHSA